MIKTKYRVEYKKFIRFLKEHSAFIGYFNEMKRNNYNGSSFVSKFDKDFNRFFNECLPSDWLDCCFYWEGTILGESYWGGLHQEWSTEYYIIKNEI